MRARSAVAFGERPRAARPAAVAGWFYPADATELTREVSFYLEAASVPADAAVPKAVIVPHAGYTYSASVAAAAYARIRAGRSWIRRVVLVGPAHTVALSGLAVSDAPAFATPLGEVLVDRSAVRELSRMPQVSALAGPHAAEHSLEVQLPFLQSVLDEFTLVPLVAGEARAEEVAEVLEAVWGGAETLIVVSSDLSHYRDYDTARRLDTATSAAIERLDADALDRESACGRVAVRGLLVEARRRRLCAATVRLANSGDCGGARERVVGYGAYVFTESV